MQEDFKKLKGHGIIHTDNKIMKNYDKSVAGVTVSQE